MTIVLVFLITMYNSLIPSPLEVKSIFFIYCIRPFLTDPDNGFFLPDITDTKLV